MLDSLQQFPVPLELGSPELDAVFQLWPHQFRVKGENDLPRPTGHTSPYAAQDPIGPLGDKGTLLAHGKFAIHEDAMANYWGVWVAALQLQIIES
ncbi:hypothetical protein llap_14136 [Limosa lapponica baueri]|uniref:Uncharacterized protein n=1 Tax=Limosa lapponica baueri TaxID=1758121 RepID=A0A2I0TP56_LIMLA|nr:hypothetical protein llap_14136 [Limosa lapponica baueri]